MNILLIVIGTIIFYTIIMPILDTLSAFIQSLVNKKIHSWQVDMRIEESEAQEFIENTTTPSNVQAVGFSIPKEDDCSGEWCK